MNGSEKGGPEKSKCESLVQMYEHRPNGGFLGPNRKASQRRWLRSGGQSFCSKMEMIE